MMRRNSGSFAMACVGFIGAAIMTGCTFLALMACLMIGDKRDALGYFAGFAVSVAALVLVCRAESAS